MKLHAEGLLGRKTALIMIVLSIVICGNSYHSKSKILTIGFGKANLTMAGIYEDTLVNNQVLIDGTKSSYEEKFDISDRVRGRWSPGSGGTRHIADSIYVSAMYGEDTNGPWAIIALDETEIYYDLLDVLEYPLIHQLGIPKDRLVFLPSHSHATPMMDAQKYQKAVFDAVKQAKENRSEVEIASLDLNVDAKKYVINRRVFVDGVGTQSVLFNDGCVIHDDYLDATENIQNWIKNLRLDSTKLPDPAKKYFTSGEVDNNLQALFFRDKKSGEVKGSFIRFAAHAVIASAKVVNGDVSADFPGYMKRKIENELGGISLFGQGASGDLRPLNKEYSHAFAKNYGENLASQIIQSFNKKLSWQPLIKLAFYTQPVVLPLMDNLFYSEEAMKEEMGKIEVLYDKESNPWQKRILQNKFWGVYRTPEVHSMLRPVWKERKQADLNLWALQVNDKVIIASQGELFTRIGKQMIEPFSDKKPLLVSIANECISYIPTDEEREKGGYEPSVSVVAPGTSDTLIQSAHRLLSTIYERSLDIKTEDCGITGTEFSEKKINRKPILRGEIHGIDTYYIELIKDNPYLIKPGQNSIRAYLITHGSGIIKQGIRQFEVNGLNLFVPSIMEEVSVMANNGPLGMLEIEIRLTEAEYQLLKLQSKLPYFVNYTQCVQYKEAIKSEKTISRMILPENIIPRFCMGSVETSGPDQVGAHSHPMLEQLFYGLKMNNCIVKADGIEATFKENTLLHIPLGSRHGVVVKEGNILNYIWMDLFRSQEDMGYIKENHILKDK